MHPGALGDPLADVDQLDLVGVDDVDVRDSVGQRGDRHAAALGLRPGRQPARRAPQQLSIDARSSHGPLVSSTGTVVAVAGQFYNVFYMTGQEYDVVVVGSGAAGMAAALTAAHQGLRQ